jgi:hypothetical protein
VAGIYFRENIFLDLFHLAAGALARAEQTPRLNNPNPRQPPQHTAFITFVSLSITCVIFEKLHPYHHLSLIATFRTSVKVFLIGMTRIADIARSIADFARSERIRVACFRGTITPNGSFPVESGRGSMAPYELFPRGTSYAMENHGRRTRRRHGLRLGLQAAVLPV